MTIKQQGGIFGRNPSFNNVDVVDLTVSNNLTVSNDLSVADDLSVSGQLTVTGGSAAAPSYSFVGDTDTGISRPTTNAVNIVTSGNEIARFNLSGIDLKYGSLKVINGQGIDFSATSGTGTSELFDDYEEGSWSPAVADALAGGNSATLSVANGYYTKVGNLVHIQAKITLSSKGSMSAGNSVYIRGLPFTSANSTNGATTFSILCNGATITNYVTSLMDPNSIVFRLFDSGSGVNFIVVSEITDTTQFIIGGTYRAT